MDVADLPDGIVAVVKRDCPTCTLVAPVLRQLLDAGAPLSVVTQDDLSFPEGIDAIDDTSLEVSYRLDLDTVPTLVRMEGGVAGERIVGWSRPQWEAFTGVSGLGDGLPEHRPGCGSLSVEPSRVHELAVRFGDSKLRSRRIELAALEDEFEAMWDRGWSDGLPLVPPTEARVMAMLEGTSRDPSEVVCVVPPDLVECTVEKVAINAVMAGCKPEYLPVVLAALDAAVTDEFNVHGLTATTWFSSPVIVVNGPVARRIGMNWGMNALGQGNRANSTIGRAVNLVIRNVGGGRPGEVDRSTLGNPGKVSFCFAEHEDESPFAPLAVDRGVAPGKSAVTLFAGSGVQGMVDQLSRDAGSLATSFASCLRVVGHPKAVIAWDALVVVSPEHGRVFREAGWDRARFVAEVNARLQIPGAELVRGAGGMAEGLPEAFATATLPKFRDGGLLVAHAGGGAGLFSAIIGGWASGAVGSAPVTREVDPWV